MAGAATAGAMLFTAARAARVGAALATALAGRIFVSWVSASVVTYQCMIHPPPPRHSRITSTLAQMGMGLGSVSASGAAAVGSGSAVTGIAGTSLGAVGGSSWTSSLMVFFGPLENQLPVSGGSGVLKPQGSSAVYAA